jgi:parallel beta-helix repeat protein
MKSGRRKLGKVFAFAVLFAMLAFVSIGCASAATHYVNPDESIQAAVNAANSGDTIIVRDGTYTENINVYKRLTIFSENGAASTIVQAANSRKHVFNVSSDYVNISGFTATGATGGLKVGIYLNNADHCNISDNIAYNNFYGIWLHSSGNNTLSGNDAYNNSRHGIRLYNSSNYNNLSGNNAYNNSCHGIRLYNSSNYNNLSGNNAYNNSRHGIRMDSFFDLQHAHEQHR